MDLKNILGYPNTFISSQHSHISLYDIQTWKITKQINAGKVFEDKIFHERTLITTNARLQQNSKNR